MLEGSEREFCDSKWKSAGRQVFTSRCYDHASSTLLGHVSLPVIIYSYTDLVEFEGTGQANLKQKPH